MNIDLSQLTETSELFRLFSSGFHLNHHQNNQLWYALEKQQAQYIALFKTMGFELIIEQRGFAYFKTRNSNTENHKLSQHLALLLLLIFEYQADAGKALYQFETWHIDNDFIKTVWKKHRDLLKAEEIVTLNDILEVLNKACRMGFMLKENNNYRLLSAVHRYLDLFMDLQTNKSDKVVL